MPISVPRRESFHGLRLALGFDHTQLRLRRIHAVGDSKAGSLLWHTRADGVTDIAVASASPIRGDRTVLVAELDRIVPSARAESLRVLSAQVDER